MLPCYKMVGNTCAFYVLHHQPAIIDLYCNHPSISWSWSHDKYCAQPVMACLTFHIQSCIKSWSTTSVILSTYASDYRHTDKYLGLVKDQLFARNLRVIIHYLQCNPAFCNSPQKSRFIQDSLHHCPMPINAGQNWDIDPNADLYRSLPIKRMIGIERYFGSMPGYWSASISIGHWSRKSC